ncbi:PREDICTED: zinc finger MYM-type protein 4 [Rhagoletis zephyria]|uniref:zinc finger MYM-type protein 4 n=1 Tax=Rhagoletis zephyria TaxID=28612 RepID=UPI000811815F|nr:PREDICTED: zinc finger MYM-type protein 4 [Rhagoletis zephyria]
MEEISSLDSFHTDAESNARPESEPPKLDEDTSQASMDKAVDGDATKDTEDGNNDEDFEQISEGSFEVDENSNGTSSGPPKDDGSNTQDKVASGEGDRGEGDGKEADLAETKTQDSADFEEVDANVSGGGHNAAAEESDMLGESDMTLPTATEKVEGEPVDKSVESMEVDNQVNAGALGEGEAEPDTEAQTSVSNSPSANVATHPITECDNDDKVAEQNDISMEALEDVEAVDDDGKTDIGGKEDMANNEGTGAGNAGDDDGNEQNTAEDESEPAEKGTETMAGQDAEAEPEREDEPVENVQEPEDSDICLIPDDPESEVTEAEKEQAILARENAEKEDAEAEAETDKDETSEKDTPDVGIGDAEIAEAEAQAYSAGAGAEAADAGSGSSEETQQNTVEEAVDAPDADEPLLEEMQTSTTETGSTPKIIIAWILSSTQKCIQCENEKTCGFRYKNPESGNLEYLCEQTCCDALLSANPGKYFIRRKKFLIEELSNEPKDKDVAEKGNDGSVPGDTGKSTEAEKEANMYSCLQCKEVKVCKYFFRQDDEQLYICSDICYNLLNLEEPDKFKLKRHSIRVRNIGATLTTPVAPAPGALTTAVTSASTAAKTKSTRDTGVVARTTAEAEAARIERNASFLRRCAECFNEVTLGDKNLLWETMDFCNEICLGKYQRTIGANCQTCHGEVPHPALGKYCVRFGFDIRQFCCAACLNEFKKGLKTCSCCQKDISSGSEGFLAPVGDKEQFKDFCSQACMRRYDSMCNPKKKLRNDTCAVCNNDKPVRVEIMLDGKEHNFCSNPCFSAFKFVSNIVADQCAMCSKYFERKGTDSFTIYTERRTKVFCTRICLNVYIIVNRRIVSCQWCKVKKYNFDMIYKQQDSQEILMCSLNCLTLYGVSINAFSRTVANCDNCNTSATPQYHLTMSDASMRNFCTYQCVMQFQSQFARAPLTLENDSPATQQAAAVGQPAPNKSNVPFPTGLPKRVKLKIPQQSKQPIQVKPNTPHSLSAHREYLPQPMYMYSAPFPVPIPIPLPIPVPIFIPTTRNSAQGILKEIKKIQDKMPADPFEAELLMMAEMVAEEKHESDSDSEDEVKTEPSLVPIQYSNDVQPVEVANNSYGEEVLQMALKMATGEYDQPAVDLESAMSANEITNPPPGMVGHDDSMSHMSAHHMHQQHHIMETQRSGRGRKRGGMTSPVSPRSNNRSPVKRSRIDIEPAQPPPQPVQPAEKPDANMCLKYTFGVNAWKQWVMTKNADIEKSSTRRRPFKTELLQMTADELNYSLCLFVKEVRKPNGTEYAPDTIYYLVLGIQQYLYENGRIDNIFTDPYYERFTDCLDEVARKFSVLYNDSQYIVTRVEEEHLWECKQLGAHSPHVLLSTLMFFNTKHFNLTTVEEHMQLSFSHIMKHWKRSAQNAKMPGTRNVLLRFYPPQAGLDANPRKKKVYEQQENEENPLRCPVRLYEFYLSKCPESVKTRNDVFYLQPERSCVPDSPVWYSTQALSQESLQKMLHRVKMVKEINIALLTS